MFTLMEEQSSLHAVSALRRIQPAMPRIENVFCVYREEPYCLHPSQTQNPCLQTASCSSMDASTNQILGMSDKPLQRGPVIHLASSGALLGNRQNTSTSVEKNIPGLSFNHTIPLNKSKSFSHGDPSKNRKQNLANDNCMRRNSSTRSNSSCSNDVFASVERSRTFWCSDYQRNNVSSPILIQDSESQDLTKSTATNHAVFDSHDKRSNASLQTTHTSAFSQTQHISPLSSYFDQLKFQILCRENREQQLLKRKFDRSFSEALEFYEIAMKHGDNIQDTASGQDQGSQQRLQQSGFRFTWEDIEKILNLSQEIYDFSSIADFFSMDNLPSLLYYRQQEMNSETQHSCTNSFTQRPISHSFDRHEISSSCRVPPRSMGPVFASPRPPESQESFSTVCMLNQCNKDSVFTNSSPSGSIISKPCFVTAKNPVSTKAWTNFSTLAAVLRNTSTSVASSIQMPSQTMQRKNVTSIPCSETYMASTLRSSIAMPFSTSSSSAVRSSSTLQSVNSSYANSPKQVKTHNTGLSLPKFSGVNVYRGRYPLLSDVMSAEYHIKSSTMEENSPASSEDYIPEVIIRPRPSSELSSHDNRTPDSCIEYSVLDVENMDTDVIEPTPGNVTSSSYCAQKSGTSINGTSIAGTKMETNNDENLSLTLPSIRSMLMSGTTWSVMQAQRTPVTNSKFEVTMTAAMAPRNGPVENRNQPDERPKGKRHEIITNLFENVTENCLSCKLSIFIKS